MAKLGISYITRILTDEDKKEFSAIDYRYLTDDKEKEFYEFVYNHYTDYNKLPSIEACMQGGYRVANPKETLSYYKETLKVRFLHNKLAERHAELGELLETRNYDTTEDTLAEMISYFSDYKTAGYVQDYADTALPQLIQRFQKNKGMTGLSGISFGYETLDEITDGCQPEEVYVFAARPSQGKTQTLINIADNMWKNGSNVLFVSMEMSREEITNRLTAIQMGINPKLLRRAEVSVYGEKKLLSLPERLATPNKFRILAGDMEKKTSDIEMAARELEPDVIFVDASYLLEPRNKNKYTAQHELIGQVIKDIKKLAVSLHKPIIVSVQFNRMVKKKTKTDLDIGYLAGSDQIGQIAALVVGITQGDSPNEESKRKYVILKNRHGGEHAEFQSNFDYDKMDFTELVREEEDSTDTEFGIKDETEIEIVV